MPRRSEGSGAAVLTTMAIRIRRLDFTVTLCCCCLSAGSFNIVLDSEAVRPLLFFCALLPSHYLKSRVNSLMSCAALSVNDVHPVYATAPFAHAIPPFMKRHQLVLSGGLSALPTVNPLLHAPLHCTSMSMCAAAACGSLPCCSLASSAQNDFNSAKLNMFDVQCGVIHLLESADESDRLNLTWFGQHVYKILLRRMWL